MSELTAEQEAQRQAAIAFARASLDYDVRAAEREGTFSRDVWQRCAEFGVLGLPIPPELGGSGADLTTMLAVMEGLGYGCRDQGLLFSLNAHLWACAAPLLRFGSDEQKRRYLPGMCDGSIIGANAASESEAGSDIFSLRLRAEADGDGYRLSGSKNFVSNGPLADLFVVYATIDPALGSMGVTAFLVEARTAGVGVSRPLDKMGLQTSPMSEVVFDGVRVPAANRLGREGRGAGVFSYSMEWERGCILACCVGAMQRQLEECIAYARQRRQFGQAIGKFQSVANRIVDMRLRWETSRPLLYQVAARKDRGEDAELAAAMAKLYISEAFVQSSLDAVRIHGGAGYMSELPHERALRDAVGGLLYSGTSDIQRNIIARKLGL